MEEEEHEREGSGRRGAWEGGKWKKRSMGERMKRCDAVVGIVREVIMEDSE